MEGKTRAVLERTVLPRYMTRQRWFGARGADARDPEHPRLGHRRRRSRSPPSSSSSGPTSTTATPSRYTVPLGIATGPRPSDCSWSSPGPCSPSSRDARTRGCCTTPSPATPSVTELLPLIDKAAVSPSRDRAGSPAQQHRGLRSRPGKATISPARSAGDRPSRATRTSSSARGSCSSSSAASTSA